MSTMREALEAAYDKAEKEIPEVDLVEDEGDAEGDQPIQSEEEQVEELQQNEEDRQENGENSEGDIAQEEQAPQVEPPAAWSSNEKWDDLPDEVKQFIIKREEDIHKGMTKFDEDRNFGLRMKEIVNPYMPIIQSEGGSPEGAFKDYLNMAYTMREGTPEQKAHIIKTTMQQFGIDPRMVLSAPQNTNPELASVQNELAELRAQLSRREQLQQQQESANIQSEIEAFASNPEHKYFNEVKPLMAVYLESGQAQDMKEAYEKAIWANETTRSKLLAEQQEAEKAKRKVEIEAKKKAAKSLSTTSGQNGQSSKNTSKSLREDLAAGLDAIYGTSRI